jgi:hypothetical protein
LKKLMMRMSRAGQKSERVQRCRKAKRRRFESV